MQKFGRKKIAFIPINNEIDFAKAKYYKFNLSNKKRDENISIQISYKEFSYYPKH